MNLTLSKEENPGISDISIIISFNSLPLTMVFVSKSVDDVLKIERNS